MRGTYPRNRSRTGDPGTQSYTLDGLNWETEGESPIVYVTIRIQSPGRKEVLNARPG
jgi:hypothetical protein